ncbi:hypothetical protein LJK87_04305 [Paenibacillus sp. P25]|nr:hypothetical protein LJK87_04305 [Paenibacillus sp. P25]
MKPDRTEKGLQAFFRQDPSYLKKYVRQHPDNKMAWYLLGREYEASGKRGKALYCYAQAGEIYEAYENQTVQLPPEALEPIERWRKASRRKKRLAVLRALVLTALPLPRAVVYAPSRIPDSGNPKAALPPEVTARRLQETKVYYLAGQKTKEAVGSALQQMLLQERPAGYGILARGILMGTTPWIGWLNKPELLLSVEAKEGASQQQIYYHDAESCGSPAQRSVQGIRYRLGLDDAAGAGDGAPFGGCRLYPPYRPRSGRRRPVDTALSE